jgi:hypothetical protein
VVVRCAEQHSQHRQLLWLRHQFVFWSLTSSTWLRFSVTMQSLARRFGNVSCQRPARLPSRHCMSTQKSTVAICCPSLRDVPGLWGARRCYQGRSVQGSSPGRRLCVEHLHSSRTFGYHEASERQNFHSDSCDVLRWTAGLSCSCYQPVWPERYVFRIGPQLPTFRPAFDELVRRSPDKRTCASYGP